MSDSSNMKPPTTHAPHLRAVATILIGLLAVAASFAEEPRVDRYGDPLPEGALLRLGTVGFRVPGVAGVGFRPTGELVALTDQLTLHVWPVDGSPKPSVTNVLGTKQGRGRLAISPCARFATAHAERKLVVWDVSVHPAVEYLVHAVDDVYKLAFSPNGQWLAVNDMTQGNPAILLCNLAAKTWERLPLNGQFVESFSFTADGKSLVVLAGRTIAVMDTATGKEKSQTQIQGYSPAFAAMSPDGTILAVQPIGFLHGPEPTVRFLSVTEGKEISGWKVPPGFARWVEFSLDGKTIFLGDSRGVREWNPVTGKLVRQIAGPAEYPLVYSADRRRFAAHGRNAVLLGDMATGRAIRTDLIEAGHTDSVRGITVSPDGKLIASIDSSGDLRVWTVDAGRRLCRARVSSMGARVVFLPDSRSFIAVGEDWVTPVVFDSATGRELRRFVIPPEVAKKETARDPWLTLDGKTLMTSSHPVRVGNNSYTTRWNVATGQVIERTEVLENSTMLELQGGGYSTDRSWLVLSGQATRIGTNESIPLIPAAEAFGFTPPAFSNRNRLVAVTRTPRTGGRIDLYKSSVVVVDLTARAKVVELPTGRPWRSMFSPDCFWLAVATEDGIVLWDLASGKSIRRFPSNGVIARTNAIAFTPDGRRLITGHDDGTVLVWDVPTRTIDQLSAADCAAAWADLANADAAKGLAAVRRLADDPSQTLPFLKERLRPVPLPPVAEIQALVKDLNSTQFKTRDAAEKALRSHGNRIEPLLRDALKANPPAETRKRIDTILASFSTAVPPHGEALSRLRAIWVLERIGTPEAKRVLELTDLP